VSRQLRIEYPGALYHVTARGNERKAIFLDGLDRRCFLELLAHVVERYTWRLHAYCLMGNHYHLLLETLRPELVRGMRRLNSVYAQRFNRRRKRSGHLFGERYHAVLIEKEAHLLEVARYVVLNPVRADLCELPQEYPWSSYRATAGFEKAPTFLATEELLSNFASTRRQARLRYRSFCLEPVVTSPWPNLRAQIYLGSESFAERSAARGLLVEGEQEIPHAHKEPVPPSLPDLFRGHGEAAILLAYREHGYRLRELAAHLDCHYATVSRRLRRLELEST
jgi:REP element-mobilizing transposase RayT